MNKFETVANNLRRDIMAGKYSISGKLPGELQICSMYGVSRQTVRRSLAILISEGLIDSKHGSGTYLHSENVANSSHEIALILRSDEEYTYPLLIFSMNKSLSSKGYRINVYTTEGDFVKERSILKSLIAKPVRAVISEAYKNSFATPNYDLFNKLGASGCPVLFIGHTYPNLPNHPYVSKDFYYGGYEAAQLLINNDHKLIGGVLSYDSIIGSQLYHGIITAQCERDCVCDDNLMIRYSLNDLITLEKSADHSLPQSVIPLIRKGCTAIICDNDEIAYWLIKNMTSKGINIPSDVSILSFDNSFLASYSDVKLSGFALPEDEPARSLCSMLLKLIDGFKVTPTTLSFRYVPGASDSIVNYSSLPLRYSRGVTP